MRYRLDRPKKLLQGAKLGRHLDDLVRKYFKLKFGMNPTCFVCGHKDSWFSSQEHPHGIQVGHYISRKFDILRWDLLNVYPQCSHCNKVHNNNPAPFTLAIINACSEVRIRYLNDKLRKFKGHKMLTSIKRELEADLEELIASLTNGS